MEVRRLPGGGTHHRFIETGAAARAKPRAAKGPTPAKPTTRSAREYIESEDRHRRRLARKRASSSRKAPPRVTHSFIEEAKRKRAHYARHPTASRALADLVLSPFGPDWVIINAGDVAKAVLAVQVGHVAGRNEAKIKAWIWSRAATLDCLQLVPAGWKGEWQ